MPPRPDDELDTPKTVLTIFEKLISREATLMRGDDLTDTEKTTMAVLLREAIAAEPELTSRRAEHLKRILEKISPELVDNPEPRSR